jgi:tRNA dimethylallyltransferase
VLALVGSTGAGKTAVSLCLAGEAGAEIVCADSRQIFRDLDIATGKPTPAERVMVPHHLFDRFDVTESVSAGRYAEAARTVLKDVVDRGRLPLAVGGSGFYLKALYRGLAPIPAIAEAVRREVRQQITKRGSISLHEELSRFDPATAARLAPGDSQRIARAVEVYRSTGRTLSDWHAQGKLEQGEPPAGWFFVGLQRERSALYEALDRRTVEFFEQGLLAETRRLLDAGAPPDAPGLAGLGYRQAVQHLLGDLDYQEAVRLTQQETRRYAKRQLTWWRWEGPRVGLHWVESREQEPAESLTRRILALWKASARCHGAT